MKLFTSLLAALAFSVLAALPVAASGHRAVTNSHNRTMLATFRILVSGRAEPGASYWVAWGPLDDHFGLVRLHRLSGNTFGADQLLPASGRTIFAYLVGHGVVHTAHGPVPGDPVLTIERIGPESLAHLHLSTVVWSVPFG